MAVIAILGGGAAGLFLAAMLSGGHDVHLYEQARLVGRKLLVAGNGGFNLTHGEDAEALLSRYKPLDWVRPYISAFGSSQFRSWLIDIGIETYVGSSGRVFPVKGTKPITVLKALLDRIEQNGGVIHTEHKWVGQSGHTLYLDVKGESLEVEADVIVYALGGASWRKTGSDGSWLETFEKMGVTVQPFVASNCGWHLWDYQAPQSVAWTPIKNIACKTVGEWCRGELMLTDYGIEGSPLYMAMQQQTRKQVDHLLLDLKPDMSIDRIKEMLGKRGRKSTTDVLRQRLNLTSGMLYLLKQYTTKEQYAHAGLLATSIKALKLPLLSPRPIDEAISTTGGICLTAVDDHLALNHLGDTYAMGEMLDWDAPTGGYLLQVCASMAAYLARHLEAKR
jgi:uncharacterized flavoprotein (TIGR03862 family)